MEPTIVSNALPASPETRFASDHHERGGTHGLSLLLWLLEQSRFTLVALPVLLAACLTRLTGGTLTTFFVLCAVLPIAGLLLPIALLVYLSWRQSGGSADWEAHLAFRDPALAERYRGKKIPMEILYEAYVRGEIDFLGDVRTTLLARNRLFRFCFTWGDARFYFRKFLGQLTGHDAGSDRDDIVPVYDRGNDFYRAFLGETMVYTSGIFHDADESLETAQLRKLDTVCRYVQMQPGDRHLDIGCGWGTLLAHAASKYGTSSTGITLSKEQAEWARETARSAGVADRVQVIVDDYRKLPARQYDKITCLEMAEHVGIKNFQRFLLQVRSMLKDEGVFYLQIAGLRRAWQYEDLVWGLFMAKHVFPGADASCPLGFVVSQAERAGFEVHRVENCGVHYGLTIRRWYDNWLQSRDAITTKYGEAWFRLWTMFLGWSSLIGAQGSSTVFMITLTKNSKHDKASVSPEEAASVALCRTERFVGPEPVATQQ
jgi:cyclopropane fatty-acyl-phospholipid synthase-like methyltransferase